MSHVLLAFDDYNGRRLQVRMLRSGTLGGFMRVFVERFNFDTRSVQFLIQRTGQVASRTDTPDGLNLVDDDTLQAILLAENV